MATVLKDRVHTRSNHYPSLVAAVFRRLQVQLALRLRADDRPELMLTDGTFRKVTDAPSWDGTTLVLAGGERIPVSRIEGVVSKLDNES